ncbi:MAG: FAD-dependent oxidoreductase [Dehalobacterium sp.]
MCEKYDVVIIGGSAAGLSTANTVVNWYPAKKVALIRNVSYTVVPCGIPYIYGTLGSSEKDKIPDEGFLKKGIQIIVNEVIDVDTKSKMVLFQDETKVAYEKLVFALGSYPKVPPIAGITLSNVFPIKKDPIYLDKLNEVIENKTNLVIIGGGFIGVEMAEQLKLKGDYNVTLVESLPHCLMLSCEEEAGVVVEKELEALGVSIKTNTTVEALLGKEKVEEVVLSTGEKIPADAVILGIGSSPNTDLAAKIGLEIDQTWGIQVDEYMQTSSEDIFACGDCCTKVSAIYGEPAAVRLASVAALEGMIAGSNLYKLTRKNKGVVGSFATKVGAVSVASAGYTEKSCLDQGVNYYKGEITAPDRHPGSLPGCTSQTKVKLLFDASTDRIIGGHVIGGVQAADMVNILSLAIQEGITPNKLATAQYATHPLLTGSPLVYQIMWAAENAVINKTKKPV